jgi:hypothetical protein
MIRQIAVIGSGRAWADRPEEPSGHLHQRHRGDRRRLGRKFVRGAVVVIGLTMTVALSLKR